jgi:hypothetical protein
MFTGAAVIAAPIKKVIGEMKRFEKQPNRQEPWTLQLQSRLFRETDDELADSLAKAGCQWYCCIFPAGCRRIKWCQPYANRDPSKAPDQNDRKDMYAFCVDDIQLLGIGQFRYARMFTGAAAIAAPIKKVIDKMKQFEKQPNQREPWILQLQSRLFRETDDEPANSLAKAGC